MAPSSKSPVSNPTPRASPGRSGRSLDAFTLAVGRCEPLIGTNPAAENAGTTGSITEVSKPDAIIGTGKNAALHIGPVDSVDVAKGTIDSLGKTYAVGAAAATQFASAIQSGSQVSIVVTGQLDTSGTVSNASLNVSSESYVAGASEVTVSGRVTALNATVGNLQVGKTTVNFGNLVFERAPRVGDVVVIVGTQPNRGGLVLATRIEGR